MGPWNQSGPGCFPWVFSGVFSNVCVIFPLVTKLMVLGMEKCSPHNMYKLGGPLGPGPAHRRAGGRPKAALLRLGKKRSLSPPAPCHFREKTDEERERERKREQVKMNQGWRR